MKPIIGEEVGLTLRDFHEMDEQVALLHQEVSLDGTEGSNVMQKE
jgi:hypothetical protein